MTKKKKNLKLQQKKDFFFVFLKLEYSNFAEDLDISS
jgi:hypothetical protein